MIGSQVPRIKIEPDRISTDGTGAAMLMAAYGVTLDEWQRMIIDCWLGRDASGSYTVTNGGLSISRQNGKNTCLEAREFYGLVINGERILHTAHQMRTAKRSFRRLEAMFTNRDHPEIMRLVKKIRYGIGEECIELKNGGMIEFVARTRQAARGFDGISLAIYDECQELTDDQTEAIMAVLSASSTGIRQQLFVGTPPYPGCNGQVFRRFRDACIASAGKGEKTSNSWHEWSVAADSLEEIDTSNKKLWYECNPALGRRLTEEFTQSEQETLSPDGFARERLGWWSKPVSEQAEKAIDEKAWTACRSDDLKPEGKTAYGVKFSVDGSQVVLAGAVLPKTGKARISVIDVRPTGVGLSWLAEWLNARYKKASCVVIDGRNGTDVLIDKISGVWVFKNSVIRASSANVVTAATLLVSDVSEGAITWYSGQEMLNESALTAVKRSVGGGWAFGGSGSELIEACSLALWAVRNTKRDPTRKMLIG